ncbi:MAG: DNA internalization-related competence protein ComEC/Rec2 [Bacteroidetes bacterium]|nr:DNA internalization-related competence protein ComEC/Rec2 [Bacteroidota bacterium]
MNKHPLINFTVLFICGIVLKNYLELNIGLLFYVWAVLIISALILYKIKNDAGIIQILLFINIILCGYFYSSLISPQKISYPFENQRYKNSEVKGFISNIELIRKDKIVLQIETDSIKTGKFKIKRNVVLLCNIYEKSKKKLLNVFNQLSVGNEIILKGNLQKGKEERNPGEFDYQKYLESNGISALFNCYKIEELKIIGNNKDLLKNFIFDIRKNIDAQINKYHNENSSALLRGLLLADRSEVDYETRQSFVNAGVIHVLAVSGLHVGFIILIFLFLFSRLNIVLRYILTIAGLILFLVVTGSPPSVFRATLMAAVLIISALTNRSYNSINSISLAAFIILLLNPDEIFNPGFQLSFSAVLSIIILYPVFQKSVNKYKIKNKFINYLLLFSSVSIAAQIGTLPFTLIYFKKLSVIALFANLLVIPVIGFIVGIGIFTLIVSVIWSWAAIIYAAANDKIIEYLFVFVKFTGNLDISYLLIPGFSKYDSVVFYILVIVVYTYYNKFTSASGRIVFTLLIIINFLLFISYDNYSIIPKNKLLVVAVDVGQGDAIFIKFPNDKTALIDAGNATVNFDTGERIIKPFFQNLGIEKIDYGFITHLDMDHLGGFYYLIEKGIVKNIYKTPLDSSLDKDIKLEKLLKEKNISINYYKNEILRIGNCRIYILNDTNTPIYNSLNINDKSGILKLIFGSTSFLFTGDAGIRTEKMLIKDFDNFLDADILKLGHHGSKTSSSEQFLRIVTPDYAIVSAGIDNKFKHPSQVVVDRLINLGVNIKRTDIEGAIIIESDGNKIKFIDWKNN